MSCAAVGAAVTLFTLFGRHAGARPDHLTVSVDEIPEAHARLNAGEALGMFAVIRRITSAARKFLGTGHSIRQITLEYGEVSDRGNGDRPHATFTKGISTQAYASDDHHSASKLPGLLGYSTAPPRKTR